MATVDVPPSETDWSALDPEGAYADVPDADPDAVIDPHWVDLRAGSPLPSVYLPPAMSGPSPRPPWLRAMALVLVALFVGATAAGVCLTYGPSSPWH